MTPLKMNTFNRIKIFFKPFCSFAPVMALALILSCGSGRSDNSVPDEVKIIFDTDMGSDCDDAGAMAVLHKLADRGEVEILGVIFSSNANKFGVGTCAAINSYYGRKELPLGQYQGDIIVGDSRDFYTQHIAEAVSVYGHSVIDSTTESTLAYKNILRKQTDKSVTIITVGHPVALYYLIKDEEGRDLVKAKVKRWIAMTHTGTVAKKDWNFGQNRSAPFIKELLKLWPTEIYFSGKGRNIITGHKRLPATDVNNPVKKAYELWGNSLEKGRSSWDQIAVLFAARPEYFSVEKGSMHQNDSLETFWDPKVIKEHHYRITPKIQDRELETVIEDLMAEEPLKK